MEYFKLTPKKIFNDSERLTVNSTEGDLVITGQTFSLSVSLANGLIRNISILGETFTGQGGEVWPDMMISGQIDDYRGDEYRARFETESDVRLVQGNSDHIIVEAIGCFKSCSGDTFPIRYTIAYQIFIDGLIVITVENEALEETCFTWLSLASGQVPSDKCKFFLRMGDNAELRSSSTYESGDIDVDGDVFSGEFIPWFWVGNPKSGLDIFVWEYGQHIWNQPDGNGGIPNEIGKPADMVRLFKKDDNVYWECFINRSVPVNVKKGWKETYNFGLGITPPKLFDGTRCILKTKVEGPFQFNPRFQKIPDERITDIAKSGYELLIGGSSSPSGVADPINPDGFTDNIELAHRLGMKVIPYVTATDLNVHTDAYIYNGIKWAVKPMITHKNKTQLMCHGCEGWREYWKERITEFVNRFNIDGLYIDMWYGKLACENGRHGCGCGGGPRSVNFIGTREMLCHAYNTVRSKHPDMIMNVNTNVMPMGMISSLADARVVGESIGGISDAFEGEDVSLDGPQAGDFLFSSYRLGCSSNIIWHGFSSGWSQKKRLAYAVLTNFAPQAWDDKSELVIYSNELFTAIKDIKPISGKWKLGLSGCQDIVCSNNHVVCNLIEGEYGYIVQLVNWSSGEQIPGETRLTNTKISGELKDIMNSGSPSCLVNDGRLDLNHKLEPFTSVSYIVRND